MQKESMFSTRVIVRLGLLISMAVVLKVLFSFTISTYRFTFYDIPLMISGVMFGPIGGAIAGFGTDVGNIIYPNLATGFNLMTISSIMWGFIPGLLLFKKNIKISNIIFTVLITSILCFGINTVQLYLWFGPQVLHVAQLAPRIGTLFVKLPIQVFVLGVLYFRVIVFELKTRQKVYQR